MNTKAIKTEKDYEQALSRLEEIFHATSNTKEGDEAEVLSILIKSMKMNIIRSRHLIRFKLLNSEWNKWT